MTYLVGPNNAWTNQTNTYPVDVLVYASTGYTVSAAGTPQNVYIRINNTGGQGWDNTTAAKWRGYSSGGAFLGEAVFTAVQGTDWIGSPITMSALTLGQLIYGGTICTGTGDLRLFNSGTNFECQSVSTGSYISPPSTIAPGSDPGSAKPAFNWYIDGTLAGGGSGILVAGILVDGLLLGSLAR